MITAAPPGPYASYCASSYDTPGSSPVPLRIARLMLSAGMFAAFASAITVRRRGFMSGSPPPLRAATVNSLMIRVKILPRLASSAPFLCLIDAHFEWPDMVEILPFSRQDDPDIGALVPRTSAIIAEHGIHRKTRARELPRHLRHRERAEVQLEPVLARTRAAALYVGLLERRQAPFAILSDRLDEGQLGPARAAAQPDAILVFRPLRHVGHQIDREPPGRRDHARDRRERRREIARLRQTLKDAVRREDNRKRGVGKRQCANVAPHELGIAGCGLPLATADGPREHRRRSIDADEVDAGASERFRHPTGPASKFEHGTACTRGEAAPERHLAASERLRVLPVVKGRVRVPASPAFCSHLESAHGRPRPLAR